MQIKIEAIKKMLKDLSLNKTKASAPKTCAKVVFVPFAFGGVSGKKKLRIPRRAEATAAILKVNARSSVLT